MIQSLLRWGFSPCLLAIFFGIASLLQAEDQPRQRPTADFGWRFIENDRQALDKPDFDETAWQTLD